MFGNSIAYYTFIGLTKLGLSPSYIGEKICMDPGAKVADGIYIGSLATATCAHWLDYHNISAIVNLSGTTYHCNRPVLNIFMDDTDVTVDTMDSYSKKFALGVAAIELARTENKNVLIHCAAGINRSATQIGFYLISQKWTYNEVLAALESANKTRNTPVLTNYTFRYLLKAHDSFQRTFVHRKTILAAAVDAKAQNLQQ